MKTIVLLLALFSGSSFAGSTMTNAQLSGMLNGTNANHMAVGVGYVLGVAYVTQGNVYCPPPEGLQNKELIKALLDSPFFVQFPNAQATQVIPHALSVKWPCKGKKP